MTGICADLEHLARNLIFDGTSALVAELDEEFTRVRQALRIERGDLV